METNISNFKTNVTLDQVMDFFNLNLSNVNQSEVTQIYSSDLYEAYRTIEKEQRMMYKSVAYIIGTLIILSNLTVVISSGLILRRDDLKLLFEVTTESDCRRLQDDIDRIVEWSHENKLYLNLSKCAVISFTRARAPLLHEYVVDAVPMQRITQVSSPKAQYLLLGNGSLADTIVGFSLIFGVTVDNTVNCNALCIFRIGMVVCPAMVSIFSVGLIAVDRYIYILHGLYYQSYFNTTRVRIGILCTWMIGITLGFMPATGWTNTEFITAPCYYVTVFPGPLILISSFLSIVPIIVVLFLYSIILVRALKTVKVLRTTTKNIKPDAPRGNSKLRISRSTVRKTSSTQSIPEKAPTPRLTTSVSYSNHYYGSEDKIIVKPNIKAKSIDNLDLNLAQTQTANNFENIGNQSQHQSESMFSISTVDSQTSSRNLSIPAPKNSRCQNQLKKICSINSITRKPKEPNKWRAITIVMLTSGSLLFTWMPFFIAMTAFQFCQEKLTNSRCMYIYTLLGGPLATLAFLNSILNPLIYAWWHKGFQKSVRNYYRVFVLNHICRTR